MTKTLSIILSDEQRQELYTISRSAKKPAGLVKRASAILLLADGFSIEDASKHTGWARSFFQRWMNCYRLFILLLYNLDLTELHGD
jgi:hypothetical protein